MELIGAQKGSLDLPGTQKRSLRLKNAHRSIWKFYEIQKGVQLIFFFRSPINAQFFQKWAPVSSIEPQ